MLDGDCGGSPNSVSNVTRYLVDAERVIYLCSECGAPFETTTDVVNHLTTIHKEQETIRALLRTRDRRLQKPITKKVKHRCELCSYRTYHRTTFDRHMMTHKKDLRYGCPICPYKAVQATNVRRHLLCRHPNSAQQT